MEGHPGVSKTTFLKKFSGSTGDLLGWFLCNRLSFWRGSRTVLGTFFPADFLWSETAGNYQNRPKPTETDQNIGHLVGLILGLRNSAAGSSPPPCLKSVHSMFNKILPTSRLSGWLAGQPTTYPVGRLAGQPVGGPASHSCPLG